MNAPFSILGALAAQPPQGFNWDTFVKIVILVALYPVWMPVVKALYNDFQGALWEEGGLFGREPTERELEELEERYGGYESPLRSETHEQYAERVRSGRGFRDDEDAEPSGPAGSRSSGAAARGPVRRGF